MKKILTGAALLLSVCTVGVAEQVITQPFDTSEQAASGSFKNMDWKVYEHLSPTGGEEIFISVEPKGTMSRPSYDEPTYDRSVNKKFSTKLPKTSTY